MASCAVVHYQSKVQYFDKERNYKFTISSDFQKCKNVGIKLFDNNNVIYESWEKGGGNQVVFFLSDRILKEGDNTLKIYCDEKEAPKSLVIKNSKYPYMNFIYQSGEEGIIKPEYVDLFKDAGFYSEFRSYVLKSEENYNKVKELFQFIPSYLKVQLYLDLLSKYSNPLILNTIASDLNSILHEEKATELITAIFSKNNQDVDISLAHIIISKPVG